MDPTLVVGGKLLDLLANFSCVLNLRWYRTVLFNRLCRGIFYKFYKTKVKKK